MKNYYYYYLFVHFIEPEFMIPKMLYFTLFYFCTIPETMLQQKLETKNDVLNAGCWPFKGT